MAVDKPLPLMVGNRAYYTLSSYEPVEIEVEVPYVTEEDIDLGLEMALAELGGTQADLADPAWLRQHFEGMSSVTQVRAAMREQVGMMNREMAEQQKLARCVEVLRGRLLQSVLQTQVDRAAEALRERFLQSLSADGVTPAQFMAQTHTTSEQLDAMFAQQAMEVAEGDAALSAMAHYRKLRVGDAELGELLGMDDDEVAQVVSQARATGTLDELHESALRYKAARIVVEECACTYRHETPAEAARRVAQYREMMAAMGATGGSERDEKRPVRSNMQVVPGAGEGSGEDDRPHRTGFKLV